MRAVTNPDPSPAPDGHLPFWPSLMLLLIVAAVVRWGRLPVAWDYWAIDYVAYPYPFRLDLGDGGFPWTRLVGLHPGQHALASAGLLALGGTVRELLLLSVGLSLAAMTAGALLLRRAAGPAAGLAFATLFALSPYQVHYGLELNNYPLLLAGAAATTALFAASWPPEAGRGVLAALCVAATVALHGHLVALPLVAALGLLALLGRRWRVLATLALSAALSAPVLLAIARMRGAATTFHNEQLPPLELAGRLLRTLVERFGPEPALVGLAAAGLIGAAFALRDPRSRALAGVLALLGAIGAGSVLYGMARGAAFVDQTPYWVHVSWCGLALVGLGFGVAGRRGRLVLLLAATPWLLFAGWRAMLPASGTWAAEEAGDPAALRAHLDEQVQRGDVLVYLWDTLYLNDEPLRRDPLFAAIRPGELGDWLPRANPFPGYCHRWRDGEACFLNATGTRGDEQEEALTAALEGWLDAGRRVHLVFAAVDPGLPPGDEGRLRARVESRDGRWRTSWADRTKVVRVEPK
jgi:hypothetical protein